MKASKKLYGECFKEYELSEATLKELQDTLLGMFLDIKQLCDKHSIRYMMSGGTCLGTIRHQGFIPWDDDLDLMMTRDEYNRFREYFVAELHEKYELAEPLKDKDYIYKQPKIYKRGTKYVEVNSAGIDKYNQIFIDVFIIENIPAPGIVRRIKAKAYDFAFSASSVCADYLYPSPVIEKKAETNDELKQYYKFRKRLGFLFSHLGGMRFYLKLADRIARSNKYTGWVGVPSAISYEREMFRASVFEETTKGVFCGYDVNIPSGYHEYLTNLYSDYMTIPQEDKRERHTAVEIRFLPEEKGKYQ